MDSDCSGWLSSFKSRHLIQFCLRFPERALRPAGVLQAVAAEEAAAAATRAAADGGEEAGAGLRPPAPQPRGLRARLQTVSRSSPSHSESAFTPGGPARKSCSPHLCRKPGGSDGSGSRRGRSSRRLENTPAGSCWRSGARDARGTCCAWRTNRSGSPSTRDTASEAR